MQPDRDELRLKFILEAIDTLRKWFVGVDKLNFTKNDDEMRFDAALMQL